VFVPVGKRLRKGCCLFCFCVTYHNCKLMGLSELNFKFGIGRFGGCECSLPAIAQGESLQSASTRVAAINSLR